VKNKDRSALSPKAPPSAAAFDASLLKHRSPNAVCKASGALHFLFSRYVQKRSAEKNLKKEVRA
jgi:hypothetical protein